VVLQKIVALACQVSRARYGALGVVGRSGLIEEFVTHGITPRQRERIGALPVGKGILGVLISDAKPLRLTRIQDDPRSVGFPAHHPPMTSFLGVPVTVRDTVYGNLYLTEKQGADAFTEADEQAVGVLASQAGVAIENARLNEETAARQQRLEAVNEVTQAILGGHESRDVLRLIARRARELAGADLATVAVPDGDGHGLILAVVEGTEAERLQGTRFTAEGTISGEVMASRRPLILEDVASDPRVTQPVVSMGNVGPAMFLPLAIPDRVFGTLAVANLTGGPTFTAEDLSFTEVFAAQAAVALDYARIREDLKRLAVLEDRERIAKELHDGVVQSLFAVGMSLQAAEAVAGQDAALTPRLTAAVEDIDRVIRDLRNYIFGLRPGGAADRGLERSLRDLVEEFRRGSEIAMRLQIDPGVASLLAPHGGDVLQVAREAVANAARHAEPHTMSLVLRRDAEDGVLEIEDDGKGFDPSDAPGTGHGLANLRDRATAIGGSLEVTSRSGEGTTVRLRVPL
jgi:signal transduction histidine kinase